MFPGTILAFLGKLDPFLGRLDAFLGAVWLRGTDMPFLGRLKKLGFMTLSKIRFPSCNSLLLRGTAYRGIAYEGVAHGGRA
jgi:hypothetical protein